MLQIRMIMRKFHMIVRNGLDEENWLQVKEDVQADFTWSLENFTQSCEMDQEAVTVANKFLISHNHAKLVELVRNGHFVVKFQIAW